MLKCFPGIWDKQGPQIAILILSLELNTHFFLTLNILRNLYIFNTYDSSYKSKFLAKNNSLSEKGDAIITYHCMIQAVWGY